MTVGAVTFSLVLAPAASYSAQSPPTTGVAGQSRDRPLPTMPMPDLVGMMLTQAQQHPVVARLRLVLVAESIEDPQHPPNAIVKQSVPRGRPVSVGARVVVAVNVGGIDVPGVVGQPVENARLRLHKLGFEVEVTTKVDARARPGKVSQQSPAAGTRRPRGSRVHLVVAAKIPDPDQRLPDERVPDRVRPNDTRGSEWVVVPRVVELDEGTALKLLEQESLKARIHREPVRSVVTGSVVQQVPKDGTKVRAGSEVEIVVAVRIPDKRPRPDSTTQPRDPIVPKGRVEPLRPLPVLMPDLVGRTFEEAMADLTVNRLELQLARRDDSAAPGRPGSVTRQSVPAGDPVAPASDVTLWVATGVTVPNLRNLPSHTARQRLDELGLQSSVNEVTRDRNPDVVLDQTPQAGTVVARGARVNIDVSVLEMVVVPDLVVHERGEAMRLLAKVKLRGNAVNDATSDLAPGLVSSQDPKPLSTVPVGTPVRLRVATGVVVPSVLGSSASDAQERLASSGLRVDLRERRTGGAEANEVFEQQPMPGQRVARGTSVAVTVARLPLVSVPDIVQRSRAEAASAIEAARLAIAFDDDADSTLPPGQIVRQDPPPQSEVEAGSIVRAAVALGVAVPPVVELPVAVARAHVTAVDLRIEERGEVSDRPESTVLRQSPEAAARVARGSLVSVVIAVRRMVPVPQVIGTTREEAERQLTRASLVANAEIASTLPAGTTPGTVVDQSPAARVSVGVGTAVRIVIAPALAQAPEPTGPTPRAPTPRPPTPPDAEPTSRTGGADVLPAGGRRLWERVPVDRAIPWIVGVVLIGLVAYRFVHANRAEPVAPLTVEHEVEAVAPPTPAVKLEPHLGETTSRLEVAGVSLAAFDVQIRAGADAGEQQLRFEGSLLGQERRVYE